MPAFKGDPGSNENKNRINLKNKVYLHRSARVGYGRTFYHGHAGGEEEKKEEELRFLRYVEQGLQNVLNKEDKPLIVASDFRIMATSI